MSQDQAPSAKEISSKTVETIIPQAGITPAQVPHSVKTSYGGAFIHFIQSEPTVSLLCGGIAGALSRTAVSPMERVKVLYQVQGPSASYNKGVLSTVYQVFKEEGYKGLFRGNGINCIRIVPYTAVQYSVYQEMKKVLNTQDGELTTGNKMIAGSVGGFLSVLATYPMDLVKTRLSIQTAKHLNNLGDSGVKRTVERKPPGMFKNISHIYKYEGGFLALYRGFIPTSLGVAPYVALNFTIYEKIKEQFPKHLQTHPLVMLTAGSLSGGIGQSLIYPLDILRRRFQVSTLSGGSMGFKYNSTLDAIFKIVKHEGYAGLYKGWTANMWKIMPSMAIQWASYDWIKKMLVDL